MSRLLIIFFGLLTICALVDGIQLSIDCGSSDSYTDENTLSWIGDEDYIKTGESVVVETAMNSSAPRAMTTLRVFNSRNKNCYEIATDIGEKVLVRASFFYGNYDKKDLAPFFYLLLDGDYWKLVETAIDLPTFYEIIYVTKSDTISVCVAEALPDMLPFISALEIRSLDMNMYKRLDPKDAMIMRRRVAAGSKELVRYPVDPFDRLWLPATDPTGFFTEATTTATFINTSHLANGFFTEATTATLINTSHFATGFFTEATATATLTNTSHLADEPPVPVLRNALISPNLSVPIRIRTELPVQIEVRAFINLYFLEVFKLNPTQNRSFTVGIDLADQNFTSTPFEPPFDGPLQVVIYDFNASANTSVYIKAAPGATLPPLINALEVYSLRELSSGTKSDDVKGLNVLKEAFDVLKEWRGDPCLPAPLVWDWLNCTDDRVTSLFLSSFHLSGVLPDFSSMDALETIDFHNNSLKGAIPDFFGNLPSLTLLNLWNNNFEGPVPTSLSKGNTAFKLDLSSNPNLINSTITNTTTNAIGSHSSSVQKNINLLLILAMFTLTVFFILY